MTETIWQLASELLTAVVIAATSYVLGYVRGFRVGFVAAVDRLQ